MGFVRRLLVDIDAAMSPTHPFADFGNAFHVAPWQWTLACGLIKVALAGVAILFPFLDAHPIVPAVGWLLAAGGLTELALAWRGRRSWVGRLTFGSGTVTLIAGAILVKSTWTGLFPVTQFITGWLLLRGIVAIDVAVLSRNTPAANWLWLMLRGAIDLGLGLLLLMGAPLSMLLVLVFGPTQELVTVFFHILGLSFLVAGIGLVAIALAQRTRHLGDPFLTDS